MNTVTDMVTYSVLVRLSSGAKCAIAAERDAGNPYHIENAILSWLQKTADTR